MPTLTVDLGKNSYNILIEKGALKKAAEIFDPDQKILFVTDSGVPEKYLSEVTKQVKNYVVFKTEQGEQNKCIEKYCEILETLVVNNFDRKDCVVALGGGVMGDLAGFAAATYMRGIDFYNIPTTLLSQVDSSIGGKTAVDFCGCKNIVGAFYQPKGVLIDPEVLSTLDKRQFSCGMAEVIKMFASFDKKSFELLENEENPDITDIIVRALKIKKDVVEKDEKEKGLRMALNFGHTAGHGIESLSAKTDSPLFHGECVGLGMLCMSSEEVKNRIKKLLIKYSLPIDFKCSASDLKSVISHDKKSSGENINIIYVDKIGSFKVKKLNYDEIIKMCKGAIDLI